MITTVVITTCLVLAGNVLEVTRTFVICILQFAGRGGSGTVRLTNTSFLRAVPPLKPVWMFFLQIVVKEEKRAPSPSYAESGSDIHGVVDGQHRFHDALSFHRDARSASDEVPNREAGSQRQHIEDGGSTAKFRGPTDAGGEIYLLPQGLNSGRETSCDRPKRTG